MQVRSQKAVLESTRESWRWFAHQISLHQHITNPPDERMKIGLMNHVSFNFRRWNREKSSRKMKCHKLEVYGLLDSNKIYIFLSFCRLGDGDRSEKDRHSPWNIKKHFRFHIDTFVKFSVEIPSGRALKNSCMFSHHISLAEKGWQNCILIMEWQRNIIWLLDFIS